MKYFLAFVGHQHWLRLGFRYRLARLISTRMSYIDRHIFFFGGLELQELQFLTRYLTPQSVVFDIGANVGHHARFFSKHAKHVYAFEPNIEAYDEMLRRIKIANNITALPHALGAVDGEATFYEPAQGDTDMSSFIVGHSVRNTVARRVSVFTGDRLAASLKLDLLKIDVEGYEKEVLTGLEKTIERDRPVIYMEYMKTTQDKFGSLENLLSFLGGYQAFTISVNRPKWVFFNDPKGKLIPYNGSKDILLLPSYRN